MFVPDGKRHRQAGLPAAVAKRDHEPPLWYHILIHLFISSSVALSSLAIVLISLADISDENRYEWAALSLPTSQSSKIISPTRESITIFFTIL